MSDKKDKTGSKNLTDDLLEGFDDSFDSELDHAFESAGDDDPLKTSTEPFIDQGSVEKTEMFQKDAEKTEVVSKKSGSGEKTEVVYKSAPDKTEFEPINQGAGENTQLFGEDEPSLELDSPSSSPAEPTRGAHELHVPTEDLSSLFDTELNMEGKTEDPTSFEATRADAPRVKTEDLSSLISSDSKTGEGRTEMFEGRTEDLSSMIDSDLLEPSAPSHDLKGATTSDLASLIQEEIHSDQEGKTEALSSMISSDVIEPGSHNVNPDDFVPPKKMPEPPKLSPSQRSSPRKNITNSPEPISAGDNSASFMKSEQSKTVRMITKKQKIMMGAAVGVGLIVIAGGAFVFMKSSVPSVPVVDNAAPAASQPEKVVESEELLRELDEKCSQASQYFITDRFQSYTEATNRLEEILATFPGHKKANSRLAEAILLKFDGYLDGERKNRVYQLLEKAESVDPNTVETLRAKARMLMVEGKLSDASVRIQQAISLAPTDADSIQTQGEIFLASKEVKSALASFAKAMELDTKSVRAKYYYYVAKTQLGALKEAKEGFSLLTTDMNAHPKSNIEKIAISIREGAADKAKTELEQYLTDKDKDLSPYEAAKGWKIISDIQLKKGNTQGAVDALEKAVSKMALNHEFAFELGNLYFKQKNFQKSSAHYSTAVTLDPENVSYLLQLGISLRQQGRLKEAEEQLKKVTTKAPKDFEGLYQYAYTKYKLGFADEVIAQLELNLKENPSFLQGKILLGEIQVEKNDFKNSLVNFQQAMSASKDKNVTKLALLALGNYYLKQELWAKAKPFYTQANQKDPENYDIHFALARIDIALGQINDAQEHLHQMQKINPESVEAKILQAGILVQQGNHDKAIDVYREVLKTKESDYETRIALAKVFMEKEKYSEALNELGQAYKYNADYYYTYYYMGIANRGLGDLAESERNLLKAIQLMPKFYKSHYELGKTYLRKEDVKKGEEEMKLSLSIEPSFLPAVTAMGDYYYDHSAYAQAVTYYEDALKKQPNQSEIMLKQAKALHEMGNDKKAIGIFQKILQLRPTSSSIYFELGVLYEENNDMAQALRMYQKSISLNSKDPRPYYQLGFLYKELKQNAKATNAFKTFLALNPNAIEKVDIEDQIQKLSK